jgi:bacterioferritin
MRGHNEVVELLNEVLTAELTAVNQYFLDAKMFSNWGFERLANKFREASIDEMKDADHLIERILYLEGTPNLQRLGAVRVGESPLEKLNLALEVEREAIERLNNCIELCVSHADHGSRDLLEGVLEGEESHADWLETQLDVINRIGEQLYLSEQLHD